MKDPKETLLELNTNLNILQEREAKFAGNAPLDLLNQLADHKEAIDLTRQLITGEISEQEWKEAQKRLLLALRDGEAVTIIEGDHVEGDKSFIKVVIEGGSTWLLVAVLAIAVLGGYGAWVYFVPTKMPLNTFNVAVAEFGQIDSQGNVSAFEDGQDLSEWMFNQLLVEYKNWPTGQPTVWHDSLGFLGKRVKIGLISGSTPEERRLAAREVAERIGAQMVVFGNIAINETRGDFRPEFYVAAVRNEADEIIGRHQLGSSIEFRLPIDLYDDRTGMFLEENLGVRVEALIWFTRGLALDLAGRNAEALVTLENAKSEFGAWENDEGKEILHYFIGREALFLSDKESNPGNELETDSLLALADESFTEALAINPQYVRAHIGLGGVFFQKAQNLQPGERLDSDALELAIFHYQQAVEDSILSAERQIETKGRLGLGISYRIQAEAYFSAEQYDTADFAYKMAIEEIERALTVLLEQDQHRLIAQAYLGLGAAYEGTAHISRYIKEQEGESKLFYEEARTAYERCIAQADKEFYDQLLQNIKDAYCAPYSLEVQAILDSL